MSDPDVLSLVLDEDGESSFSGFSHPDVENTPPEVGANITVRSETCTKVPKQQKSKKLKSIVLKPNSKQKSKGNKVNSKKKSLIDKFSEADLHALKEKLGIFNTQVDDDLQSETSVDDTHHHEPKRLTKDMMLSLTVRVDPPMMKMMMMRIGPCQN
ncbi:hypothetical protein ACF0H5_000314 [Mactra antiquata]